MNNKKDKLHLLYTSFVLLTLSSSFLTGCARYSASTLTFLPEETAIVADEQTPVLLSWKTLSKEESRRYLGRDVEAKGYLPIQMTLRNNTSDPLYLSSQNFSLPLSSPEEVAPQMHTSTGKRVAAWSVGGVLFLPLFIPAIVDGFGSAHANESLDRDYASKSLKKDEIIPPYSVFNGIVFIPKEYAHERIQLSLINQKTNKKICFSDIPVEIHP
jgi:hypothetical protein